MTRTLLIILNGTLLAHLIVATIGLDAAPRPVAALTIRGGADLRPQELSIGGFSGGFSGGFNIGFSGISGFSAINGFNFGGVGFGGFSGFNFGGGLQGGISGFNFGGFVVTTDRLEVAPRDPVNLSFGWTVPAPGTWRDLERLEVRLQDEAGVAVWLRWDEATNKIRLVNARTGRSGRGGKPGGRRVLRRVGVRVKLARSSVVDSGPTGTDVIVNFPLAFGPKLAGRTLRVEAFAADDAGEQHGFEHVGNIAVASGGAGQ